jgi:hypothetical protein
MGGTASPSLDVVLAVIPALPAPLLARMVEHAIERLDQLDGDPDVEANGDELDGCPEEDPIFPAPGVRGFDFLGAAGDPDDAEDDDPDTSVEDDPQGFDPEEDMCLAGDDRVASGSCTGAGLACEDTGAGDADDAEMDGREFRTTYRNATRRRACTPRYYRAWGGGVGIEGYRFKRDPATPTKRKLLGSRLAPEAR